MNEINEIVESIQREILTPEISLSTILLKAKLLAHKLKNDSFKQWVKHEVDGYLDYKEVPDYRVIHTPLLGYISNGWNGYKNMPISLFNTPDWFQKNANKVHFTEGIQTVEELALRKDFISFDWTAEQIMIWNLSNQDSSGHQCYQVKRPVTSSIFSQILLTVRSRLQDFVLELSDLPWKLEDRAMRDQVEKLVSVIIHNNSQGGSVSTFDQREQQVYSQNNAARDIYIEGNTSIVNVQDTGEFIREVQKLKNQLFKAGEAQIIDTELVTDVDYELASAIQEARKPDPSKESVLKPMEKAKDLLSKASGATEFCTAIINLIAAGTTLFVSLKN
jgi:AbiTii